MAVEAVGSSIKIYWGHLVEFLVVGTAVAAAAVEAVVAAAKRVVVELSLSSAVEAMVAAAKQVANQQSNVVVKKRLFHNQKYKQKMI